jgi:hypothetical protein
VSRHFARPGRRAAPSAAARSRPAAAALALLLAGCPIPQTLPEYPSTGTVAPPRILSDQVLPPGTTLKVAPDCAAPPSFSLYVTLVDENTLETIEARWFVDYEPDRATKLYYGAPLIIPGPTDGITTTRPVVPAGSPPGTPSFVFQPYGFDDQKFRDDGGLHVVELVVSQGFDATPEPGQSSLARPYRTPASPFETQLYRWVFHYVPAGADGACGYTAP